MKSFTIFPAIDLKDGRVVRLRQGQADAVTVYSDDPAAVARRWQAGGGRYLHVVDLDGAFGGEPKNWESVRKILAAIKIPVELGGGLRTEQQIQSALDMGVTRCVIGTKACESPAFVHTLVKKFGERIVVGVDAHDGMVAVRGWTEKTSLVARDFVTQVAALGVKTIIFTDISTDGMMVGPNLNAMAQVADAAPSVDIIASGGISAEKDIAALKALGKNNLVGVIVGKALYEGKIDLRKMSVQTERSP
jgi:phosphoribosylformimino-5-aminoimidazole carboxamide ribotide isomerase